MNTHSASTISSISASTIDATKDFFIAYWSGETGAQPLRVGRDHAIAVWDTELFALRYANTHRSPLQIVEVSGSKLASSQELLAVNP